MRTVQCLVLLGILISADGVRVPNSWSEPSGTRKFRRWNPGQGFGDASVARKMHTENNQGEMLIYNPALRPPDQTLLSQGEIFILNPVENPRYRQKNLEYFRAKSQKYPQNQHQKTSSNEAPKKIIKVKPFYEQYPQGKNIAPHYSPQVYKEYPKVPTASLYSTLPSAPKHLVVPAEQEESPSAPNQPVLLLTKGYPNVLVQGSHNKKNLEPKKRFKEEEHLPDPKENLPKKRKVSKKTPKKYFESPLNNINYRDDSLHEPSEDHDVEREDNDKERISDDEEEEAEEDEEQEGDQEEDQSDEAEQEQEDEEEKQEVPYSEHADPKPIPTKPIYPGEGLWAKRGLKHKPYVTQHRFIPPAEDEKKPDGYEAFEDLERFFEQQKNRFGNDFAKKADEVIITRAPTSAQQQQEIKPPNSINPNVIYDPFNESSSRRVQISQPNLQANQDTSSSNAQENYDQESEEEITTEFVPLRLYTQVRNSENVAHEPYNPSEHAGLKEIIRDSKVHTIYSEEGFEDSAYDHAGHLKKAEEDQGYAHYEREKEEQGKPKLQEERDKGDSQGGHSKRVPVSGPSKPLLDSIASDSSFPVLNSNNHTKPAKTNNFITTQEVKTTQVKDKTNGDVQLEIQSEVKVIMQPNNSTKAHKYVKIYPKILKDVSMKKENATKDNTTESPQPTETPKVTVKVLDVNGTTLTRRKRDSGSGYEDVKIDTDFIDEIEHKFAPPKPDELDVKKYPYYTMPEVNDNSPLRYAENMDNIPKKHGGELGFYKMADRMGCPDVPRNIDPVPDRVKNAREESDEDEDEGDDKEGENEVDEDNEGDDPAPKEPRIKIGDTIDCLKLRYFGENPLDSPIFREETVGPVKPIFQELAPKILKRADSSPKPSSVVKKAETKNVTNTASKIIENEKAESISNIRVIKPEPSERVKHFGGKPKPTATPLVTLITTPKYTIKLTPKNIYDQIKLLDHLPEDSAKEELTTEAPKKTTTGTTERGVIKKPQPKKERTPKELVEVVTESKPQPPSNEDKKEVKAENTAVLEPEALIKRRKRVRLRRPVFQIFDVNKFLTTTPLSRATTEHQPKGKSEVFYKEEIQPSEQFNVLADVLNNIQNSSRTQTVPVQSASDFAEPSAVTISSVDQALNARKKAKQNHNSPTTKKSSKRGNSENYHIRQDFYPSPKGPGDSILAGSNTLERPFQNDLKSDEFSKKISKRRRKPSSTTAPNFAAEIEDIIGLVPPQDFNYRTIVIDNPKDRHLDSSETSTQPLEPAPVLELNDELPSKRPLHKYLFPGLKPPNPQRARPYSDFTVQADNTLLSRRVAHVGVRAKRSPSRPAYAEVSRNRGRQTEGLEKPGKALADDGDDYVPHRPKNYHYDENTGKIVYHNKPKEPEDEEGEEYEEIEIPDTPGIYLEKAEDATHPTPEKVTTKILLATATPPPAGQGLLDFVAKLKNNPNYKSIPDPTTLKPGQSTTTEAFVTVDPKSTNPPEFLSILSKVKSDKNYKHIADPEQSQSKTEVKTTTLEPEEEYEDEEEEDEEEEKVGTKTHSRPTRQTNVRQFNVADFLPKIQTPISSEIPKNFFQKHVVERLFPRLRYMTLYDIAREYYKQTDMYKFLEKRFPKQDTGGGLQIFDIGEYLPKINTITPKTTIDYSKYKTIERVHTKPANGGSTEEGETETKEEAVIKPVSRGGPVLETNEDKKLEIFSKGESTPSTTQRIVQLRRGTKPTTSEAPISTTRRSLARTRKPSPSAFRTKEVQVEPTEKVARVYPEGQSSSERTASSNAHEKAKRVYRRRPVRIRYTTERQEEEPENVEKIVRRSLGSEADDLRRNFEEEYLEDASVEDTYEDIKQEIVNGDDEYRPDDDDKDASESETKEIVHKKDANGKKGDTEEHKLRFNRRIIGNDSAKEASEVPNPNKKNNVEITNRNYDKNKKHGGNYRKESEESEDYPDAVDINIGQYKEDTSDSATSAKLDVDIINENYNKTQKHGGNYKSEKDEFEENSQPKETKLLINVSDSADDLKTANPKRLSDVVPKPDHFYSDPQLPNQVNQLKLEQVPVKLASEELAEVLDEDGPSRRSDNDELFRIQLDEDEAEASTTQTPIFIKDPSKRLYFYAPV